MGTELGTEVFFMRDSNDGTQELPEEFLIDAQVEDVVAEK